MPHEKAPGPDRYNVTFYKKCWSIIKTDLVEAFGAFYKLDGRALHQVNSAYTILLPKKPGACELATFDP